MNDLMYKELRLAITPAAYVMPLLAVLLLIPNWIYFIAFMYVFITIPVTFVVCKDQRDIDFSILLPVRKRDIVKARFLSVVAIEMLQIIVAVAFALISNVITPYGNLWLMDLNFAFFGFVFVMYALFNAIFMTLFYKSGYKIAIPVSIALVATIIYAAIVEYLVQSVAILNRYLDGSGDGTLAVQLPVLALGILIFIGASIVSYRISANSFEKTDI